MSGTKTAAREASLFRNNRSQAVRIPREFELPGTKVLIHRDGDRLVIEPMRPRGLLALIADWEVLDEEPPRIGDSPPEPVDLAR